MCDAQAESGVQNISDLVRKKIWGIFETEMLQKIKLKSTKETKNNWIKTVLNQDMYLVVMISWQE